MSNAATLAPDVHDMRIAFVGESLIDFTATGANLAFQGHEGGAPTNSAIAAARLGQPTGFITQLSTDLFGERLLAHLQRNGVDTRFVLRSPAPSTLAFVERTPSTNRYAFYTQGTADTLWAPAELPELPPSCAWLHFGSIALLHEPAASRILDLVRAQRDKRLVLLDPNARPSLIADPGEWRHRCQGWIGLCDVLKLSEEDLALLAPAQHTAQVMQQLLALGPQAVVLTRGEQGATLYREGSAPMTVRAPAVEVRDTIGAGDTFGAALSVALLDAGVQTRAALARLDDAAWTRVLLFAAAAAALNCTRPGADPPTRAQVDQLLAHAAA